jgi:hypothetical protein
LLNGGGAGAGSDSFRFSSALGTIDVIQDFSHFAIGNHDVIQLDDDVFIGAGPVGVLAASAFVDWPAGDKHRMIASSTMKLPARSTSTVTARDQRRRFGSPPSSEARTTWTIPTSS